MSKTLIRLTQFMLAASLVAGSMGGCKCQRDVGVEGDHDIDRAKMIEKDPTADRPSVYFPQELRSDNDSVNTFVVRGLNVCAQGDYDAFRELFGTAFQPIDAFRFEESWKIVRDISIKGIYEDPRVRESPEYYAHVIVRLRESDSKGRQERQAVLWLFKEAGFWRMGQAPSEVVNKILTLATRPAEEVSASENSP